jgi:hypothetical protein
VSYRGPKTDRLDKTDGCLREVTVRADLGGRKNGVAATLLEIIIFISIIGI